MYLNISKYVTDTVRIQYKRLKKWYRNIGQLALMKHAWLEVPLGERVSVEWMRRLELYCTLL